MENFKIAISAVMLVTSIWLFTAAYRIKFKGFIPANTKRRFKITDIEMFRKYYSLFYLSYGVVMLIYASIYNLYPSNVEVLVFFILLMSILSALKKKVDLRCTSKTSKYKF
jgi:hypothetical protein